MISTLPQLGFAALRPLARSRGCRLALVVCLGGASACIDSSAQQNTAQAIMELGDQLSAMREDNALLQSQIDSLRGALARQDTLLRQMATMAGVPVPPR
ncbi:MAG TPA: hypothetical protein VEA99_07075 [Gemmatimonadaceae bacterium]|nr:hypothetical protein [Gemmatimonadaceae bacterium]